MLWTAVQSVVHRHAKFLLAFIKLPTQTDEIRRSSVMITGSHLVANCYGLPMSVSEL